MAVNQRIYIYFSDGSSESESVLQTITAHPSGKFISIISVQEEVRSTQVLQSLLEEDIRAETTQKGAMRHSFLVRDGEVALYPASDVKIVLALVSQV